MIAPAFRTAKGLFVGAVLATCFAAAAFAQKSEQIQAIASPAVNTQSTLTIPAVAGESIFVDYIALGACEDATGGALSNQNFTSTNLDGFVWQSSEPSSTASSCVVPQRFEFPFGGLKAAAAGAAVTIVSPAAATHTAFPMLAAYHYAPF